MQRLRLEKRYEATSDPEKIKEIKEKLDNLNKEIFGEDLGERIDKGHCLGDSVADEPTLAVIANLPAEIADVGPWRQHRIQREDIDPLVGHGVSVYPIESAFFQSLGRRF